MRGDRTNVIRLICASFSLLVVAACSLVGASVDPLSAGGAGGDCAAGQQRCDGQCVDVTANVQHCGSCGSACKVGEACNGSQCQIACPGGQVACDGLCYATSNDPRHCGSCTTVCAAGEVCGDGRCSSTCPEGQINCGGSCADLQTDSKHCGACGTTCGPNDECVEGKCLIACRTQLNQGITDPWGSSWDGLERAATSYAEAEKTCTAFRGRLPTASELYRVSATQSATVGQTIHTNPLWSMVPFGGAAQRVRLRLSDAQVTNAAEATPTNYRCICSPPLPKSFTGLNCFGPNGSACVTLDEEAKRHNLDVKDRPPLPKSAALWECGFYGGHLVSHQQLAEAVQQDIGAGSGNWLHVANEVHHQNGALVRWTNTAGLVLQSGGTNSLAYTGTRNAYPFRCIGENYQAPAHAGTVPGEWSASGRRKIEENDLPAQKSAVEAADVCFKRGGHLPTMAELGEMVERGLPNGSGAWQWTSDQTGHDSVQFTLSIMKWSGVETSNQYGGGDMTWSYKTDGTGRPHRCIYYPVDAMYTGPPAASCAGGCMEIALPGGSGAKMWVDNFDRAPAVLFTPAVDACRKLGGHLLSQRDWIESIRAGLPNGTDAWLYTSDLMLGNQADLLVGIVKWAGTKTDYADVWTGAVTDQSTWSWPYDARVYRCMWTNELR